jgi:hypothetical protein
MCPNDKYPTALEAVLDEMRMGGALQATEHEAHAALLVACGKAYPGDEDACCEFASEAYCVQECPFR